MGMGCSLCFLFSLFDISWWEGREGRCLQVREIKKNTKIREEENTRKTRWVEAGIIPRLTGDKNFTSCFSSVARIRAQICYRLLSTCVSLLLFIYCSVNKNQRRVTSWMKRRYSLISPGYCKNRTFNSDSETTLWTPGHCNSIWWHVILISVSQYRYILCHTLTCPSFLTSICSTYSPLVIVTML